MRGVITDVNEEPVKARITLSDLTGEELIGVYTANEKTGRYLMMVEPRQRYTMTVEAQGFEARVSEVNTIVVPDGSREIPLDIVLNRNENTARVTKP